MSQLSYSLNLSVAYEGCIGDTRPANVFAVRNNSGADIPFGRFVVHDTGSGTSEMACKLPSASGDKILGVLSHSHSHYVDSATGLADDEIGNVVSNGLVWMVAEEALNPSDPVFVRYDATGATGSQALGRVRNDADTSKAVAATNCRFVTSAAAAGDLILVQVNIP